ncbi:MAG: cupin domain-containing protein [Anaerolineales bacterium]|nr:cupin domain-containing protein [Anaerolineales bacterium]
MRSVDLMANFEFHEADPYAEPLHVSPTGRILRFMLKPGQSVREHNAPHSPVYIVGLKGEGRCAGGDGQEHSLKPGTLVILEPGEHHSVWATDGELVFLAILHGIPPELRDHP